ncbi:GntR family transcriptional regulator [Rhodococcus sp. 06-156-3C]|uniref:GntR family transcriptional regulator n=1 Tax=Nocardiaceae TaxID=85025 RepID=UPI0005230558|nr:MULTISPECIES: GntR family transcriptional regulator [Rhodococcus]OZD08707.1 GntR family transcriptional regulator [Rhodococcus sp. 06-156-4C]OZD17285.1 GntR family transcriptional regulator [Rhodococcus sp. 06-156-3C]OZD18622.1 GntR family transcriptional regulator [Rhodococcus sp. 06-156-4a]OZD25029.1 GntR family transcriptional regulator [Rhodococcus sp. 06-156-3b]OZD34187.1 GntR family transcriptional regulator [Rhodococcus sp. 06-156-3]
MTETERPSEPVYRTVANKLRSEIAAGAYKDGLRLPTEAELAAEHGASRQTIRRAFHDLVAEGIVHRVPGRGTFATEQTGRYLRQLGSIEDLMNLSSDTTMHIVSPLRRQANIEAASRLRLDTDLVYGVTFRREHDGVPFAHTRVFLPETVARHVLDAPELAEGASSTYTLIGLLEPHLDSPITRADQSITVAPATADVADVLRCEAGHPMLRVDRLYSNDRDELCELASSYFLPEHYTYRITLRR